MCHATLFWGVNILSKFQLPSSYGLGETLVRRYFQKLMPEFLNEWIVNNYEGVCRTNPATPGLLIMLSLWTNHVILLKRGITLQTLPHLEQIWFHRSKLMRIGELKDELRCNWVETEQDSLSRQVLWSQACKAEENFSSKCQMSTRR